MTGTIDRLSILLAAAACIAIRIVDGFDSVVYFVLAIVLLGLLSLLYEAAVFSIRRNVLSRSLSNLPKTEEEDPRR